MTVSEPTTDHLIILRGWWPKTWFDRLNEQQKYEISRKGAKAQSFLLLDYDTLRLGGFA
jgi:hypothetical protein